MEKGITLIELLLVVALIALLGSATTPFLSRFVLQTNFDSTVDKTISSIRKTQAYAMDGKENATWGICVSGTILRVYSGTCANPTISENFSIPSTVTIVNLTDTTFNKRGEPSGARSITIKTSLETSSIEINSTGGITVN